MTVQAGESGVDLVRCEGRHCRDRRDWKRDHRDARRDWQRDRRQARRDYNRGYRNGYYNGPTTGTAAELLDLPYDRVMLVAAHVGDLRGAQAAGLRTAYVPRPLESGPGGRPVDPPDPSFDLVAEDFVDLAARLGA